MSELDLLKFIHPKLTLSEKKDHLFKNILDVLAWYDLLFLEIPIDGWLTYLMGLFTDLDELELEEACRNLVVADRHRAKIFQGRHQLKNAFFLLNQKSDLSASQVYRICHDIPVESLLLLIAQTEEPKIRKNISQYLTKYRGINPTLRGEDLKSLGYLPGPLFRKILDHLRDGWLDGKIRSREEEIDFLQEHFPIAN